MAIRPSSQDVDKAKRTNRIAIRSSQIIVMVISSYLRGFSVIAAKAIAISQRITIAMEKCAKSIMLCFPLFVKRKCFVLGR